MSNGDIQITVTANNAGTANLVIPLVRYLDSSFDLEGEMNKLVIQAFGWKI